MRTEIISTDVSHDGNVRRTYFNCPCGRGRIIEEHDSTPGFRERWVEMDCKSCEREWQLAPGLPVSEWELERVA